jgi:hypothetical protein
MLGDLRKKSLSSPTFSSLQSTFPGNITNFQSNTINTIRNNDNAPVEIKRLVVAYHQPRNLKSILAQRCFREKPEFPASSFVPEEIL